MRTFSSIHWGYSKYSCLLWFECECEMSPNSSCVWISGPSKVTLFGEVVKSLWCKTSLAEVDHCGQALMVMATSGSGLLSLLPACYDVDKKLLHTPPTTDKAAPSPVPHWHRFKWREKSKCFFLLVSSSGYSVTVRQRWLIYSFSWGSLHHCLLKSSAYISFSWVLIGLQ